MDKPYDPFDKTQGRTDPSASSGSSRAKSRDERSRTYDTIIIGAGAAGMTASIYCSRYKLNHLIFGEVVGGQFVDAVTIENYPGFASISGLDLAQAFKAHVESYGVKIRPEKLIKASRKGVHFVVTTGKGEPFEAHALIIATGRRHRRLDVPGEAKFLGRGVSYCATCDAPLFRGKLVAVVGGGDTAIAAAIHAAAFAKKVYLIHRRGEYRAEPLWIERLKTLKNVEEVLSRQVREIKGKRLVEEVVLDRPFRGKKTLKVQGVLVEIGFDPVSELADQLGVELDERRCIQINPDHSTSIPGVFAAGDITHLPGGISLNQIVNSTGEGAGAAAAAYQYLCQLKPCEREA